MFLCSFLWIEITFAFFHSLGNTLFLIQDLNFIWRGLIIDSPLILTMLMLFISWPWALLGLKFWTFFKILFLLTLTDEAEFSFFFFFFWKRQKNFTRIISYDALISEEGFEKFSFFTYLFRQNSDRIHGVFCYLKMSPELTNTFMH